MSIGSIDEPGDLEIQREHFFARGLLTRTAVARLFFRDLA